MAVDGARFDGARFPTVTATHLHIRRAVSDHVHGQAVQVRLPARGAGTVAADNPQLTTRLVSGPSPLRVVFDPERRLASTYRVFTDGSAPMDRTNWSDTVVSYYLHGGAIALALDRPLLAVNHLEGHALTARLTDGIDFPYLLSMIPGSFMSRANSIVIPGGRLDLAMQLILTPLINKLMDQKRRAL